MLIKMWEFMLLLVVGCHCDSANYSLPPPGAVGVPEVTVVQQPPNITKRISNNQQLSFTGILNGLLDSFINEEEEKDPEPDPPETSSETPQESSPESTLIEDDEEEEEEQDASPESPPEVTQETSKSEEEESNTESSVSVEKDAPATRNCEGDCRNIIFGIFLCDEMDNEAYCPEPGSACCITNANRTEETSQEIHDQEPEHNEQPQLHIPPPPNRYVPYNQGPPPPPHHFQKHPFPQPRYPLACPRYCVKNFLEEYCEKRLPAHFACGVDGFCCYHDVVKEPLEVEVTTQPPVIEEHTLKILGPCTEDVGSCVSKNIVNIICFGHATPTELYTCPRTNMKCCARKTALPKDPVQISTPQPEVPVIHTRNTTSIIQPPEAPRVNPRVPIGQYVCGVKGVPTINKKRRKKRVVGGSDSLPGEWCWQVALINSLNQYLCGGALIGTQWVLTAAHCVTNIVRSGDAIYVRVGDHDLTSRYGSPGAQTLRVATTYIHHNHNSQTLDNDIALLKLQNNAALREGVCLVCLPSRFGTETPGKRCTVTGYGYMGESGPIPLRIREASLPIVSEDECVRKVNAVTEKVFALPMSSFCAGGQVSNDACQGDGGGPLVCRSDGDTGYYELTGLVSWGFGCGRENVPGVYVKVSSFIGWIHQIIRTN